MTGNFTRLTSTEIDSDEDEEDIIAHGLNNPQPPYAPRYSTASSVYEHEGVLLHDEDEDFPSEEYDIVHCQYLSASRGDWDEAVGMRRLGLGYSDAQLEKYIGEGHTAAHIAATFGHLSIFQALTDLGGVEPNSADIAGDTPMHCACRRGHLEVIRHLTETHGVPATALNEKGMSPVQIAVQGGFVHVMRYFLGHSPLSVAPSFRDTVHGASLLHWACLNSRPQAVEYLLLTHHLSVENKAQADDSTCLLWASYGASLQVVQYLVEQANADPKVKARNGMTCLHMATLSGSVEKTLYLMETVRLSITEKDNNHKSPFDLATGKCAVFLQERKAKGFVVGSVVEKTRKVKKKHLT